MAKLIDEITHRWLIIKHSYLRFTSRFIPTLRFIGTMLDVVTFIASVVCLVTVTVRFGFDHSHASLKAIYEIMRGCQIAFIVKVIYDFAFLWRQTVKQTRIIKWLVDIALLMSLLPMVYPRPDNPWIVWLDHLLYSGAFLYSVLTAYAVVDICYSIIRVTSRRINPSLILSASFLVFIIIGSLLLSMPRCTVSGINYFDALFVATSAVCITGLSTVDVATVFTPAGLLVLAILIQVGALGIMTFTSFFAIFFSGNTTVYSQLMVKDMVYSKSMAALVPTLIYILLFTFSVEVLGAVGIFLCIHDTLGMSIQDELIFSGFHSLSAFCNAGFSNVEGGLSNPMLLHSNQIVYLVITVLVAAGGIGFPILVNFKSAFASKLRRLWRWVTRCSSRPEPVHLYDLNTKIVLVTSLWLTLGATLLFFLFEYDNTLEGMSLSDKIIQSVFNSLVPRSSGFSSVNPAGFLNVTIVMFLFLMWIGGASQSTAGGIKVNTFATMWLNLKAVITGRERIDIYGRTIATYSVRRAHAVVGLSIIAMFILSILLIFLEPHLPLKALIYEAASALFTVGSSLGITPMLSIPAKLLLCFAMFIGRVGIISLLSGIVGEHTAPPYRLPQENIIIN